MKTKIVIYLIAATVFLSLIAMYLLLNKEDYAYASIRCDIIYAYDHGEIKYGTGSVLIKLPLHRKNIMQRNALPFSTNYYEYLSKEQADIIIEALKVENAEGASLIHCELFESSRFGPARHRMDSIWHDSENIESELDPFKYIHKHNKLEHTVLPIFWAYDHVRGHGPSLAQPLVFQYIHDSDHIRLIFIMDIRSNPTLL